MPHETILLIDDEAAIRDIATRVLGAAGYRVFSAGTAEEAVMIARTADRPIDLVVCDVRLPGVSGPALVETLRTVTPLGGVLYASGHHDFTPHRDGVVTPDRFLAKPFRPSQLVTAVRRALDDPAARGAAP